MSFAIIETGGKQYKVSASKILEIEKLNVKVGQTIKFDNVLLLNDDYTPMEFVVMVLEKIFNKKQEEATQIMLHVHKNGIGVCGTFTYEVAESKCKSVMDMAKKNEHPLQCTMVKS